MSVLILEKFIKELQNNLTVKICSLATYKAKLYVTNLFSWFRLMEKAIVLSCHNARSPSANVPLQ